MLKRMQGVGKIDPTDLMCQFARSLNDDINPNNQRDAIQCGCNECVDVLATIEDSDDASKLETGFLDA